MNSGTNLSFPALQSGLRQNERNIELAKVTKDTVSSPNRESNMTRLAQFLVKNVPAMLSAGPKTEKWRFPCAVNEHESLDGFA